MMSDWLVLTGLLAAYGVGCGGEARRRSDAPDASADASTEAASMTEGGAGALGNRLPLAVRLDCSMLSGADAPTALYLGIAAPFLGSASLSARVEGSLCADHDISQNAEAPAVAIRCPPEHPMRSDSYPTPCFGHYIELTLCSPGFQERKLILQELDVCAENMRASPSCESTEQGIVGDYPYEQVTYELIPAAEPSTCPSFAEPPQDLLADNPTQACPCHEDAGSRE